MRKLVYSLVVSLLLLPSNGYSSEKELSTIVEAFGLAIENKDRSKFLDLFIDKGVSWVGVFSSEEYERLKMNDDGEGNVPEKLFHSSPEDFIEWVVNLEGSPREEFTELKIATDGDVASLYFDYKFYLDSELQNWGSETWLLVKAETGWKIQAVNFSYTGAK